MDAIGRYQIKGELKRGGMSTVYRAFDPVVARDVAIKILPPEFLRDPVFHARFEQEARVVAALEHPAIVPVYDFGEEQGQPYLVMRYMAGGSLADRLRRGFIHVEQIEHILEQIAAALDAAHKQGVIHRDLKPGNILFDAQNNAYVADFGIAKLTTASPEFTSTGIIGTPAYMSPEQARGKIPLDGRSDIYSLGVILYEMLSGQQPYQAETPLSLAMAHVLEPVPRLQEIMPGIPATIDSVVRQALAKDREARFASASALATAFRAAVQSSGAQWYRDDSTLILRRDDDATTPIRPLATPQRLAPIPAQPEPQQAGRHGQAWLLLFSFAVTTILLAAIFGVTRGDRGSAPPGTTAALLPSPGTPTASSTPFAIVVAPTPSVKTSASMTSTSNTQTPIAITRPVTSPSPTPAATGTRSAALAETPLPASTPAPTDTATLVSTREPPATATPTPLPTDTATAVPTFTPTREPPATATSTPLSIVSPPQTGRTWTLVADSARDFPGTGQNGQWSRHWSIGTNNFEWQDMGFDNDRWCFVSPNDWDLEICQDTMIFNPRGDVALQWQAGQGGTYRFEWDSPTLLFYNHLNFTGSQGPGTELAYSAVVEDVKDWAQFFWLSRANTPYHIQVYRMQE